MTLYIGVATEQAAEEQRVALTPDVVRKLSDAGSSVLLQQDAGARANFSDIQYREAGAEIMDNADTLYQRADILLCVSPPEPEQIRKLREGSTVIGFLDPYRQIELLRTLKERQMISLAMELIPRSTRAQSMDALSSQRSIAGYRAVLLAAVHYGRFLPMMTTPTGTVRPATVLVIGAGVSGLQAIATARRLGAMVEASDVRAAAREQVESLGGRFLGAEIDAGADGGYARELSDDERAAQEEMLARHVASADIVITTAELPGRPSPRIISEAMVAEMHAGAVIIDLAAAGGGNCALTCIGEKVLHEGVLIYGPRNAAAEMPEQASALYAHNLQQLLGLLIDEGDMKPDWSDDILKSACLTREGEIRREDIHSLIQGEPTS